MVPFEMVLFNFKIENKSQKDKKTQKETTTIKDNINAIK